MQTQALLATRTKAHATQSPSESDILFLGVSTKNSDKGQKGCSTQNYQKLESYERLKYSKKFYLTELCEVI